MRIMKLAKLALNMAAVLAIPGLTFAQAESHIGKLTGHSKAGQKLYTRYCWGCHGARGDGNGENASYVTPMPRNFVAAEFKCRSTPTGTLPTDEDLFDAITRGFNTSNMPQWSTLTKRQRADLVAFIKTLSPRWKTETPGTVLRIPPEPVVTMMGIDRGKELYQKLECWKCHGQEGRGDGPSAATLTDSNNQPIHPYNFSMGGRFKCGSTNEDLYRIFMTGLDGTPMPSFADVVQPIEAWDLVHYLRTLQVTQESPEMRVWETSKEGTGSLNAKKVQNTPTGSGLRP